MTISQEIQSVVRQFHAIHRSVLIYYLCKYFSVTQTLADKTIHKSAVGHFCYELDNGFVAEKYSYKVDTSDERMSKALRVAFEFMGVGERTFRNTRMVKGTDANTLLMVQQIPSEEFLEKNPDAENQLIQISYIMRGNEFGASHMLASRPVPERFRSSLCRIAIIEDETDISKIENAGYRMFIRFKKGSYSVKASDIIYTDKETRWNDVPAE